MSDREHGPSSRLSQVQHNRHCIDIVIYYEIRAKFSSLSNNDMGIQWYCNLGRALFRAGDIGDQRQRDHGEIITAVDIAHPEHAVDRVLPWLGRRHADFED
jgi:hypothetical protein